METKESIFIGGIGSTQECREARKAAEKIIKSINDNEYHTEETICEDGLSTFIPEPCIHSEMIINSNKVQQHRYNKYRAEQQNKQRAKQNRIKHEKNKAQMVKKSKQQNRRKK